MTKHVTAIYRNHAVATEVKRKIEALGIGGHDVSVIPDTATTEAHHDDHHVSEVDALNLPDDDQRTYKRAVREGNHIVSVKVSDDDHIARVEDAMRHPEHGLDIDAYDTEYRAHPDYAADMERDRALAAREGMYARDTTRPVTHARTYY